MKRPLLSRWTTSVEKPLLLRPRLLGRDEDRARAGGEAGAHVGSDVADHRAVGGIDAERVRGLEDERRARLAARAGLVRPVGADRPVPERARELLHPAVNALDVGRESDAGEQDLDALGDLAGRVGRIGAFGRDRVDDGTAPVVDHRPVAGLNQVPHHRRAHLAQADESDLRQVCARNLLLRRG